MTMDIFSFYLVSRSLWPMFYAVYDTYYRNNYKKETC